MEYRNILLIKMSSVGDVLHTLPFAAALRELFPQARISWLVHPQFAGFVPDPPLIDEVIYFDKAAFTKMTWGERFAFIRSFRRELTSKHFDLVIDMQGLFKSAAVAFLTGCPNKIGYAEMREGSGLVSRAIAGNHRYDHVIERYLDVARYLGANINEIKFPMPDVSTEEKRVRELLQAEGMQFSSEAWPEYVVMAPGARWVTKKWPAQNYVDLAQRINSEGKFVVLGGGPEDKALGEEIKNKVASDKIINLAGQTSLREMAALIKNCLFYISADTGPLHIATAYKKPLLAFYGPTKADRTGPYGNPDAVVLLSPAACAGCLKKHCQDWHCMTDITPEMAYKAYREKLEESHA